MSVSDQTEKKSVSANIFRVTRAKRPFGLLEQFVLVDGWSLVAGSLVQRCGG